MHLVVLSLKNIVVSDPPVNYRVFCLFERVLLAWGRFEVQCFWYKERVAEAVATFVKRLALDLFLFSAAFSLYSLQKWVVASFFLLNSMDCRVDRLVLHGVLRRFVDLKAPCSLLNRGEFFSLLFWGNKESVLGLFVACLEQFFQIGCF